MDPFGDDPFSPNKKEVDPFASFGSTTSSAAPQVGNFDPFSQNTSTVSPPPPQNGNTFDPFETQSNTFTSQAQFNEAPPSSISFDPFAPAPPLPADQSNNGSFDIFAVEPYQQQQNIQSNNNNFDMFGSETTTPSNQEQNLFASPSPQQKKDPLLAPEQPRDELDDFFSGGGATTSSDSTDVTEKRGSQTLEDFDIWGNSTSAAAAPTVVPTASIVPPTVKPSSSSSFSNESTNESSRASEVDEDDEDNFQLELQASMETYEVVFPYETKLGMLLEKFDELELTSGGTRERTLVKMVIEGGAADTRGLKMGSKLVSLNGFSVLNKPYLETLDMVKTLPRPLTIVMEKVGSFRDASQGECYIRKDMSYGPPSSFNAWQKQYFVIGGAVAKPFVLQFYDNKQSYEEVVVNMFQNKGFKGINLKAYKLNLSFRCGPITTKLYAGKQVSYFWLKNPKSNFKVLKVASENAAIITGLRIQICKHVSQG